MAEGLAEDVAEGLLEENPEGLQSTPRGRLSYLGMIRPSLYWSCCINIAPSQGFDLTWCTNFHADITNHLKKQHLFRWVLLEDITRVLLGYYEGTTRTLLGNY